MPECSLCGGAAHLLPCAFDIPMILNHAVGDRAGQSELTLVHQPTGLVAVGIHRSQIVARDMAAATIRAVLAARSDSEAREDENQ